MHTLAWVTDLPSSPASADHQGEEAERQERRLLEVLLLEERRAAEEAVRKLAAQKAAEARDRSQAARSVSWGSSSSWGRLTLATAAAPAPAGARAASWNTGIISLAVSALIQLAPFIRVPDLHVGLTCV